MWLLAAFIAVPIIEIALFIWVGGLIGVWPTLLLVVASAVLGMAMVRSQGFAQLRRIQASFDRLDDPAEPLAHGAMILLSAALLIIPGFFTDAIGLVLLIPAVRTLVYGWLRQRVTLTSFGMGGRRADFGDTGRQPDSLVIDGEYEEIDPDSLPAQRTERPSGWTRH